MMPTPRDGRKTARELRVVQSLPEVSNDAAIAAYLAYQKVNGWRPKTIEVRVDQLRRIGRQLPVPFVAATEDDVVAWHSRLEGKPETRASYVSALKVFFRWMVAYARPRLRIDDPTLILERPRIPVAQPRPMLDRHYDLALACAVSNPELYLWLGLMGCSGLRCCEIAWMQVGDVEHLDNGSGLLHITGKGGKQRTVPIGQMLLLTMRPFLTGRGPVFTRPSDGRAHTPKGVSARVNVFLRGVGVPVQHTAHTLRHRFGTDYHALDPDLYRQAKLMGHSSVDTTQRYTEISPAEAAQYIERLTLRRLRPSAPRRVPYTAGQVA
jgi:integrase/recombinase XerC